MNISEAGLALIKRSEGLRLTAYRDVAGLLTIGYGHKIVGSAAFDNGITEATADAILANDVQAAEGAVTRLVKVPLTQGQFDALVDFTFNLGAGRLADSTLLVDLNAGRYDAAALQLLLWDHAGGELNPGLEARREAEHALWAGLQPCGMGA